MPLYEYECTQCKRHTEKIQKFSDVEITECPHCGGKLERVISAPAVSFKGGGWYADGYGNAKPSGAKSEASEGKGGDSSGAGAATDSVKPASSKDVASAAPAATSSPAPAAPAPAPSTSEKK